MKKRFLTKMLALILGLFTCISSIACTGSVIQQVSGDKVNLYVELYKGGLGYAWLEQLAGEFEKLHENDVTVVDGKELKGVDIIINSDGETYGTTIKNEYSVLSSDLYYTTSVTNYHELAELGYLLDLTETVTEPANDDESSVIDRLSEEYHDFLGIKDKDGKSHFYGMPLTESKMGLNYDVEMFYNYGLYFKKDHGRDYTYTSEDRDKFITPVDYIDTAKGETAANASVKTIDYYRTLVNEGGENYYKTKNGEYLACGPDGIYGTIDDGEPETYEDFLALCSYLAGGDTNRPSISPIIYLNKGGESYLAEFMFNLALDFMGKDNANTMVGFDGKLTNVIDSFDKSGNIIYDGELTLSSSSSKEDFAKVYKTEGYYRAIQLLQEIYNDSRFISSDTKLSSNDHFASQKKLMLSSKRNSQGYTVNGVGNKRVAFLLDGSWWEKEAYDSGTFDTVVNQCGEAFKKENRMFKQLALPKQSDEKLGKEVFYGECMMFGLILNKVKGTEKEKLAREFFKYTFTEHGNQVFTKDTGLTRPFNYSYEPIEDSLSYFSTSTRETINNSIKIPNVYNEFRKKNVNNLIVPSYCMVAKINGVEYWNIISMYQVDKFDAKEILEGIYTFRVGKLSD